MLLVYVDLHGEPRGVYVPEDDWSRAVERGVGFGSVVLDYSESLNGRSMTGAASVGPETGEIVVVADPKTRVPIPWVEADHERAACRIRRDGDPSPLCSRTTLASVQERLRDRGFTAAVGTDYEFVLHENFDEGRLDDGGEAYLRESAAAAGRPYHTRPLGRHAEYLTDLHDALERMDVSLEGIHKESGRGIYEAVVGHESPLAAADGVTKVRSAARGVGAGYGLTPSFLPRPFDDVEGNGQHYHCSLWRDGENAFADGSDEEGLSALARRFVGGVLSHADGMTALCAPTVNSYKRLQPDLWAPIDPSYGFDNKTCLVRIPPERGERTRIEVRLPDSFANPYLALSAVFAAGLDGIERDLEPGAPTTENTFERDLNEAERLPESLGEALDALSADSHLVDALGERLVEQYERLKRDELERFRTTVTDWELREYADRL